MVAQPTPPGRSTASRWKATGPALDCGRRSRLGSRSWGATCRRWTGPDPAGGFDDKVLGKQTRLPPQGENSAEARGTQAAARRLRLIS